MIRVTTESVKLQYLGNISLFSVKISGFTQSGISFTLEVSIFSHLLTAGDRTIFTDKIVITMKNH